MAQESRLLLALWSDDYTQTELYAFDLADGSRTLVGAYPATGKLSGYRDGQPLTMRPDLEAQVVVISQLQIDTGEEVPLYTVPNPLGYDAAGLVWVPEEDTCYCTISNRVVRLRPDGETTTMAFVSGVLYSPYYGDAAELNRHYALRSYDGILVRQLSESAGERKPVTLANDDRQSKDDYLGGGMSLGGGDPASPFLRCDARFLDRAGDWWKKIVYNSDASCYGMYAIILLCVS